MDEKLEVQGTRLRQFLPAFPTNLLIFSFVYQNMSAKVTVEAVPMLQTVSNDMWKEYSIVYAV